MLSFKTFTYFYISLIFFLQLLYNGGLVDFTSVPAMYSISLLYLSTLFFFPDAFGSSGPKDKSRLLIRACLINLIVLGVLTLFSECIEISYIEFSKYASAGFLLLILYQTINSNADFHEFSKIFMGFVELYILLAMAFYFYSKYVLGTYFSGICFTLVYPYYHATFVIATVPFTLYLYFRAVTKKEKLNYLFLFLIQCVNVSMTSSRVAQLNLISGVFLICLSFFRLPRFKPDIKKIMAFFIVITFFGAFFTTDAFVRIFKTFNVSENYDIQSPDGRLQIYRGAVSTFLDHPVKGVGLGLPSLFLPKYRVTTMTLVDCHNIVLNKLCEGGLIYFIVSSFVILLTLFYTLISLRASLAEDDTDSALISAAAFISLFSLYFQGLSMPHNYLTVLVYLEYIAAAGCLISIKLRLQRDDMPERRPASVIDFEFGKKLFRYVSIFSFFTMLLFCFAVFSDIINAFPQWYLNLSFILIFYIILLKYNPGNFSAIINNAGKHFIMKLSIASLIIVNLFFLALVFKSGFCCEEGINAMIDKNHREALAFFEKSVSYYPAMASYLHIAPVYYSAGRFEDAYRSALFFNQRLPYELAGLNNLAACQLKTGRPDRAYETLLKLYGYGAQSRFGAFLGAYLIKNGRVEEGIDKFALAALERPDYVACRFFSTTILKDPDLRSGFIKRFKSLAGPYLEKNMNFISIPSYNLAAICYHLYCRGQFGIFREVLSEFKGFGAAFFTGSYRSFFFKPESFVFNGNLDFNSGTDNIFYKLFYRQKTIYSYISRTPFQRSETDSVEPHFGLKRWMVLKCLIDPFGVNDASPDLPPHLIAVASLIPVRKELTNEIIDFYNLFFIDDHIDGK